jgi:hypothetical protein
VRFEDENHEQYKEVSSVTLPVETIPQNLQNVARKILGKHSPKEVREWSHQLMSSYQMLHAVEKPMNLEHVMTPFGNTTDLKESIPTLVRSYEKN